MKPVGIGRNLDVPQAFFVQKSEFTNEPFGPIIMSILPFARELTVKPPVFCSIWDAVAVGMA